MSDERVGWEALLKACEKAGLPVPVISPGRLGNKIQVMVGDFKSFDEKLIVCLNSCLDFCYGYLACQESQSKYIEKLESSVKRLNNIVKGVVAYE